MADKLNIENVLVQIRARLLQNGIKLWLAPYYIENIGPVDSEMKVSIVIPYKNRVYIVCKY